MSKYRVTLQMPDFVSTLSGPMQARISQVVGAWAEEGTYRWKDNVWKARLWQVEKERYIQSITWRMDGPFSAEITADYKLAGEIENGRPARDLKRALQTSRKTRVVKSGKHAGQRYLIIPFRHNVPTPSGEGALAPQMPTQVYKIARTLAPSRVLPPGSKNPPMRLSASGHLVPQHSYEWGGRLPAGLTPKAKPHHATDLHADMVRMATGGGKHAYLTFRIMGEWSNGWVVQPRPGLRLAEKTSEQLQQMLNSAAGKAVTLGMLKR